jgi:hypothetical protein
MKFLLQTKYAEMECIAPSTQWDLPRLLRTWIT